MSGENVSLGNMGYNNPYLMQQYGGGNDDFAANLHFKAIEQSGRIPGLTETAGSPAFKGNPETDTFEKSGGPGILGTAAITGGGALAGGAGGYYFMNNPIKDLKNQTLNPAFFFFFDKADLALNIKRQQELLKNTKAYNLAQLAKAQNFDSLPDEVKTFLKNNNLEKLTPEEAKGLIEAAGKKVEDFDLDKVAKQVTEKFRGAQYYNNVIAALPKAEIDALRNAQNADELSKLIVKHKDLFGLKGTEDEILQQAKALAAKGNNAVADKADNIVKNATARLNTVKKRIFDSVDSSTGKLLENADDGVKAIFKDFKWQQAKKYGKWGAAIAAAGTLLYGLFGGGSGKENS